MATQIKFGTSGWRAVVAEEFTFENVRRAVHGIARYVVSQKSKSPKVIVGRDPRFLGETFVAMAAENAFESLKFPVRRIAVRDIPMPFSPGLEDAVLPDERTVTEAVRAVARGGKRK